MTSSKVVQITNIAPQATRDQMQTLFGYLGKIEDIRLYPTIRDVACPVQSRICYVKFVDATCVSVAQHMTNTVFIDRALIVIPFQAAEIPDEQRALELTNNGSLVPGLFPAEPKLPPNVTNQLEGVPPNQVITTHDPRLVANGLPLYPALQPTLDAAKIEEIRRTLLVTSLDDTVTALQLIDFFSEASEVKYLKFCNRDGDLEKYALVELTDQHGIVAALQLNGRELAGRPIKVYHATQAIAKPQAKSNEAAQREIEEAMSRVKEAQNLISAAIDPVIGMLAKEKKRSRSRSRRSRSPGRRSRRSRSRSSRRSRHGRSRSRSGSRRAKRSRSRSPRKRKSRSPGHSSRSIRSRSNSRRRSRSRSRRSSSKTKSKSSSSFKVHDKPKDKKDDKKGKKDEKRDEKRESTKEDVKESSKSDDKRESESKREESGEGAGQNGSTREKDVDKYKDKDRKHKEKTKDIKEKVSKSKSSRDKSGSRSPSKSRHRSPPVRKSRSPARKKSPHVRRKSRSPHSSRNRHSPVKRSRSRSRSHKDEKKRDKDRGHEKDSDKERKKRDKKEERETEKGVSNSRKVPRNYDEEEEGFDAVDQVDDRERNKKGNSVHEVDGGDEPRDSSPSADGDAEFNTSDTQVMNLKGQDMDISSP